MADVCAAAVTKDKFAEEKVNFIMVAAISIKSWGSMFLSYWCDFITLGSGRKFEQLQPAFFGLLPSGLSFRSCFAFCWKWFSLISPDLHRGWGFLSRRPYRQHSEEHNSPVTESQSGLDWKAPSTQGTSCSHPAAWAGTPSLPTQPLCDHFPPDSPPGHPGWMSPVSVCNIEHTVKCLV